MTVLIDDRAGSQDLIDFPPLDECGELTRLDSGDVMIVGNGPDGPLLIGVEVKSIFDLISSANTGRLQSTQIPAMVDEYDVTWVLHYGKYQSSPRDGSLQILRGKRWRNHRIGDRPVPYGYIEALLLTLTAAGVHVKRVIDIREAAEWIGVLYRWWSKPWSKHRGLRTFDNSRDLGLMPGMDAGLMMRARVAAQLPGVGFERALSAARHFTSIQDMINAGPDEWEGIPGIGRVIAKAVREAVK